MDDRGTTPSGSQCTIAKNEADTLKRDDIVPGRRGICHYCGRPGVIVSRFPHRGYGNKAPKQPMEVPDETHQAAFISSRS